MSTAYIPASTDILTTTSCAPPALHLLPWVDKIVHLGNIITNKVDMLALDMDAKKRRYVGRNIEINQDFFFAAIKTKIKINNIYNSNWFGSVLWNLFGPAAVEIESSYNRSMKVTMKLHYATFAL